MTPVRAILISFLALITAGTMLLLLPCSTNSRISLIDAFFTSTSAVCVTGLSVLDTARNFTTFGKIVIIMLVQLGGLGIMTFSLALLSFLGGDISLQWKYTIDTIYSDGRKKPAKNLLLRIILYTASVELTVSVLLFIHFIGEYPADQALLHAVFLGISSFCNAGFSTFSNSLGSFTSDPLVILPICFSIIMGGLGFIVIYEISRMIIRDRKFSFTGLSTHTKIVLITTLSLIMSGLFIFYILEHDYAMKDMSFSESLLTSFFNSVTCRTAGFNTLEVSSLRPSTISFMIFLMFTGGSPGSIAGGVKTTTLAAILLLIFAKFRGRKQITIGSHALDRETLDRATTLVILSIFFIITATFLLLTIHEFDRHHSFLSAFFEVISAFGTVGLSMGATSQLDFWGKTVIIIVMFVGRIGPLTLIIALASRSGKIKYEYPEENLMIG